MVGDGEVDGERGGRFERDLFARDIKLFISGKICRGRLEFVVDVSVDTKLEFAMFVFVGFERSFPCDEVGRFVVGAFFCVDKTDVFWEGEGEIERSGGVAVIEEEKFCIDECSLFVCFASVIKGKGEIDTSIEVVGCDTDVSGVFFLFVAYACFDESFAFFFIEKEGGGGFFF